MSMLAHTSNHFAEFESGFLSVVRANGDAVCLKASGIAGQFRDCLRTHGAETTIACFLRIAKQTTDFKPMYKPESAARILSELNS